MDEHDTDPRDAENRPARRTDGVPELVGRLTDDTVEPAERRRLLARLTTQLARSAKQAGPRAVAGGQWLTDVLLQVVPHLTIRDLDTLRDHYDGLTGDTLADALVRNASRTTAAIGAAGGALAAVEWAAPPTLLTAPVQLAAETLAVVAVEVKLVAELHEAYGHGVRGPLTHRMTEYTTAWAQQRGIDLASLRPGAGALVGAASRKQIRDRVVRRFGRGFSTLGPLLTGAALGAVLNRRATLRLADKVRKDLRKFRVIEGELIR
jgi:hypothetical protein